MGNHERSREMEIWRIAPVSPYVISSILTCKISHAPLISVQVAQVWICLYNCAAQDMSHDARYQDRQPEALMDQGARIDYIVDRHLCMCQK